MSSNAKCNQEIKNLSPYTTYVIGYLSALDSMVAPFGECHRFVASDDPNRYVALSEGGNSLTPIIDLVDNGSEYTTRLITGAAKSTNSGDVTFDCRNELLLVLRPGSGFCVTRQLAASTLTPVTTTTTLDVSGSPSTDQYSAIWAVG